ncbi:MAG: ATP-dependent RNA helicase HrpA [Verrucomicrobiota bacterium]
MVAARWNYPGELPVVQHRQEILAALRTNRVIVVVSDTGSGKTTQLPKMVAEVLTVEGGNPKEETMLVGCTQPRRIAAASVAKRVAEELGAPLGGFVGYQVRFEDRTGPDTRIKFMTDGILLAEMQGDPLLRKYRALILDEAHERSLNIDFLLGCLKQLLEKRDDLTVVISSATLDAGSFAEFFATAGKPVPVIVAPGRLFPVSEFFLPPDEDEELPRHVARAMDWLESIEPHGDVLVFLPGEREIRDCAETLEGRGFPNTEILPLFARLGLADQQRIFQPGNKRRIVLATNVAETSLTIPRIACVIDSGLARVNRWSPARGVQRLQIEPVSRASARQRMGRCGRVRDGVCVRLYGGEEMMERSEFTDPEIRRSSLAGVILRMKALGLPDIGEFPLIDPPAPKAVSEGKRALVEIGAIHRDGNLTDDGRVMARLPVEPRLARMLMAADDAKLLADVIPIIAALESNDPRERPAEKTREADAAHARWKHAESDFLAVLVMWHDINLFRDERGRLRRNALRKFCGTSFLNMRRVVEWSNVVEELGGLLEREWRVQGLVRRLTTAREDRAYLFDEIHKALLAGAPRQFGLWDRENKTYRSASGGFFSVFPGSGLFGAPKRHEWLMGMELVETTKLWARRVAKIDPAWIEEIAPHLCRYRYGNAHWDVAQGAVYGTETVICGGLVIVPARRVHYGRVDAKAAHEVFLREGVLAGGLRKKCRFYDRISEVKETIRGIEEKLRRVGMLWSDDAILRFLTEHVPAEIHTAAAFYQWLDENEERLMISPADVMDDEIAALGLEDFPDVLAKGDEEYPLYYRAEPGTRDDGVTIGLHVDQLPGFSDWLPAWGVDGNLRERAEAILRGLPKDYRRICQPIGPTAEDFAELWTVAPKEIAFENALAAHLREILGAVVPVAEIAAVELPAHLVSKIWICDDDGEELAFGNDVAALRAELSPKITARSEAAANAEIEETEMLAWNDGTLPEIISTPGGATFPALVDEGNSVGIRAFSDAAEAAQSHRAGGARLLLIAHDAQVAHLRKRFPLGLKTKIELPRLGDGGTGLEDLLMLAAEGAMSGIFPRNADDFSKAAETARGRWFDAAAKIGRALDEVVEELPAIRSWAETRVKDRNFGPAAADLLEQTAWLFRARCAWRAGYAQLLDYPRFLRGIRSRIGRIESLPIMKDLEKIERINGLWTPWFRAWSSCPDEPRLWEAGWMLEEFRISLFAPDVPVSGKVSEKRIRAVLEGLGVTE